MLYLCCFLILLDETMKNKSPHARGGYVGPIESRARLMLGSRRCREGFVFEHEVDGARQFDGQQFRAGNSGLRRCVALSQLSRVPDYVHCSNE